MENNQQNAAAYDYIYDCLDGFQAKLNDALNYLRKNSVDGAKLINQNTISIDGIDYEKSNRRVTIDGEIGYFHTDSIIKAVPNAYDMIEILPKTKDSKILECLVTRGNLEGEEKKRVQSGIGSSFKIDIKAKTVKCTNGEMSIDSFLSLFDKLIKPFVNIEIPNYQKHRTTATL